ncbi:hypothetical protein GCM10017562_75080 [Streptomyces roseofulvus]
MLADVASIHTRLVVPDRKRSGRALLPGEEEDNDEHHKVHAVTHIHNLTVAA